MKRVTLFGQARRKAVVLEWLQELGCLHVTSLGLPVGGGTEAGPGRSKQNYEALRYLLDNPTKMPHVDADFEVDAEDLVARVLANRERRRELADYTEELEQQIAVLEPWGDFEPPRPDEFGGLRFWYYIVPLHRLARVRESGLTWQRVNKDLRSAYVVVLSREEPEAEDLPAPRVELPERSLSELRTALKQARNEREELRLERQELTRWTDVLAHQMVEMDNAATLREASAHAVEDGPIFMLSGWVPVVSVPAVTEFAVAEGVACTVQDPGENDSPPIMLVNRPALAPGEELVGFFQLPGYRDWDPSAIVYVSFVLFFAMIFSDAGYGAVFGLLVLAAARSLGKSEGGRRIRKIGVSVTVAAVVYGILSGSYFGVAPPEGSWLDTVKILDVNDFDSMMKLCIGIGSAHVVIANLLTARRRGFGPAALPPLGWVAIVLGGLGWYFGPTLTGDLDLVPVFKGMLGGGAGAILLFSSDRPFAKPLDIVLRLFDGLKALSGVSTAFGDILSYLRLFALGLSSASLAVTFNQLAGQMMESVPGVGILLAILIVIIGHALNAVLCILGGLVHGLRLNLIEFYHWSIFDEGAAFRALRKKETLSWTA